MEHAPEERQAIKEAVSGFLKTRLLYGTTGMKPLSSTKSFTVSRKKELSELADALTSDFMATPVFSAASFIQSTDRFKANPL
ncbi:hypothetical protein PO124_22080 [Bacillus licheniformis]|nr:hypothetical protein [Bacillus licheniformis]